MKIKIWLLVISCFTLTFAVSGCANGENSSKNQQTEDSNFTNIDNELPLVPFE